MNLEGKVAIITGAGGGVGNAAAIKLAEEGAKLFLVDLSEENLKKTKDSIKNLTVDVHFMTADVTKEIDIKNYVNEAMKKYGKIDIFFNNAGIDADVTSIDKYDENQFNKILDVNTKGVFLSLKHVLKVMREQHSGSIINTASIHGLRGVADRVGYVASKHAVIGMTKTASTENAEFNIRVNAICPATIVTNITKEISKRANPDNPEVHFDKMKEKIPAKRFGKPEDVANLVSFLASNESNYITGAIIPIDGGTTAAL